MSTERKDLIADYTRLPGSPRDTARHSCRTPKCACVIFDILIPVEGPPVRWAWIGWAERIPRHGFVHVGGHRLKLHERAHSPTREGGRGPAGRSLAPADYFVRWVQEQES